MPGVVQPNAYKEVVVTSLVSGRVTQVNADLGDAGCRTAAARHNLQSRARRCPDRRSSRRARSRLHISSDRHGRSDSRRSAPPHDRSSRSTRRNAPSWMPPWKSHARGSRCSAFRKSERSVSPDHRTLSQPPPIRAPLAGGGHPPRRERRAEHRSRRCRSSRSSTSRRCGLSPISTSATSRKVRVGSPATITSASYPGMTLRGRVSYIDPQVQPETRTAKLRVEVAESSAEGCGSACTSTRT